jgi:hypothetical protein
LSFDCLFLVGRVQKKRTGRYALSSSRSCSIIQQ